jgi:hypothetical protein
MAVLFVLCPFTRPPAAVADYPASGGTVMPHDVHWPNVDEAIPTCGKRDTIGNVGFLPFVGCSGFIGLAMVIGQTRVSRTATARSFRASSALIANHRCFVFQLFRLPSRQRARGPPSTSPICLISYRHTGQVNRKR